MLIVIDTETTGLAHEPDARPWQIAAVVLAPDGREIAAVARKFGLKHF